jgi:hypothetical protein
VPRTCQKRTLRRATRVQKPNLQRDGGFDAWRKRSPPSQIQRAAMTASGSSRSLSSRTVSTPPNSTAGSRTAPIHQASRSVGLRRRSNRRRPATTARTATAIDGPHRFPAISVVAATVAVIAPMHPRARTAARRWVPTPSEARPKLVTVTAKKSGATSNNRKG